MTREVGAPESHDTVHHSFHVTHGESHRGMHGEAVTALSSPGEAGKSNESTTAPEGTSALHPLLLTNRRRNPADVTAGGAASGGAVSDAGFQPFDSRFSLPDLKISGLVPDRDSGTSVSSLISRGIFHDARSSESYQRTAAPERFAADTSRINDARGGDNLTRQPEIVVQYGDTKGQPAAGQPPPDFVIRKDGSIEVH